MYVEVISALKCTFPTFVHVCSLRKHAVSQGLIFEENSLRWSKTAWKLEKTVRTSAQTVWSVDCYYVVRCAHYRVVWGTPRSHLERSNHEKTVFAVIRENSWYSPKLHEDSSNDDQRLLTDANAFYDVLRDCLSSQAVITDVCARV